MVFATRVSRAVAGGGAATARQVIPRLGFIGLGNMGLQMAQNLFLKATSASAASSASSTTTPGSPGHLLARREFVVCDPNPDNVLALVNFVSNNIEGADVLVVDTPLEVARRANTIFTVLPSSPQVQAVYLGGSGVVEALHSPTPSSPVSAEFDNEPKIFVDSTTLDVHIARDVAAKMSSAGAGMVDAPMSGGVVGATAGTLSFMVGGPQESFDRAKPFLEHMGSRVVHCGDSGNGLIAKLCNNHILGINQVAIAEGMLLGTSLGLAPDLLAKIINTSTGRSWPSEVNNPVPGALGPEKSPPCERDYAGGFASKLMLKDMLLAAHAAQSVGLQTPVGEKVVNLYSEMIEADGPPAQATPPPNGAGTQPSGRRGDKDFSVVFDYLRHLSQPPK
ncbi:hypothetical protein DL93DRAFT_2088625 [Clavulina sp. PMI_390]|nr:hypothetical protein DL93DRAFT_2088625 [Clavulina sp. PMI_390]